MLVVIRFIAYRDENVHTIDFDDISSQDVKCFATLNETSWLWYRRLGHASIDLLSNLSKNGLVQKFVKDNVCDACQFEKQTKNSFKRKNHQYR